MLFSISVKMLDLDRLLMQNRRQGAQWILRVKQQLYLVAAATLAEPSGWISSGNYTLDNRWAFGMTAYLLFLHSICKWTFSLSASY